MKNFNDWSKIKTDLESSNGKVIFHESEIWWSSLGLNLGHEEDGKNNNFERPILVLKKFNKDLFIGIPLSTKIKESIFYINLQGKDFKYSVLLSQARVFSSKRLIRKINKMSRGGFNKVKEGYRKLLKL